MRMRTPSIGPRRSSWGALGALLLGLAQAGCGEGDTIIVNCPSGTTVVVKDHSITCPEVRYDGGSAGVPDGGAGPTVRADGGDASSSSDSPRDAEASLDSGSDSAGLPPPPGNDASASPLPFLPGVNLAGAEFGGTKIPGIHGQDYIYPNTAEVDYFMGKGMKVFRLPFRWERLQPSPMGAFDPGEQGRLDAFVKDATSKGAYVLIDPHNYARYRGQVIGRDIPVAAFADFWTKLASRYKDNERALFGLMNEPNSMPTELWRDDANAAIAAIRATGARNLILVPGNGWTGAHSWESTFYGTSNAVAMASIVDPGDNFAYELHQYLDGDSSGTTATCVSDEVGANRLKAVTAWLKKQKARGFLGEFGAANSAICLAALDNMLSYIDANRDVWMGWSYWAAGPWWGPHFFSIEPMNGQDAAQTAILVKHR